MKLELPEVTLLCLDTANYSLAVHALLHSMGLVNFGKVVWLTDQELPEELPLLKGIDIVKVPTIESSQDYSYRCVKELAPHVKTSHALVIQWDGYVINPEAWNPDFLKFDYIGAPWPWHPEHHRVGNGGFSLRSRKLLGALRANEFDGRFPGKNEDEIICHVYPKILKKKYGIKIADEDTAWQFSFEAGYGNALTFGFHGLFNFGVVMPEKKLVGLVKELTPRTVMSPQFQSLLENCINMKLWDAVYAMAHKILEVQPRNQHAGTLAIMASKYRA